MPDQRRRAALAPGLREPRSSADLIQDLGTILQDEFSMAMLNEYTVVVEGHTDRLYLNRTAELIQQQTGKELLSVGTGASIEVVTPGNPTSSDRGGTRQMARLARRLQPYVFNLEAFSGLLFLFDHDHEGRNKAIELEEKWGYKRGVNSLTLDPREHEGACSSKDVVIEDLLSLSIQERYFTSGRRDCDVHYRDGRPVRYMWQGDSKGGLCDFVCESASLANMKEFEVLLNRIRSTFQLT